MEKGIRYIASLLLVALLAYNSVYFRKLDQITTGKNLFNATEYASRFWNEKLPRHTTKAIGIDVLLDLLQTDKDMAFKDYSHALGISNIKYFLIKGSGIVQAVGENQVSLETKSEGRSTQLFLATEYVFGNAVRDASGEIDINAFTNSMDFNNVSAEINRIIRERVIPPFSSKVKTGDRVDFIGAIELNQEHLNTQSIEVIPIELKIKD